MNERVSNFSTGALLWAPALLFGAVLGLQSSDGSPLSEPVPIQEPCPQESTEAATMPDRVTAEILLRTKSGKSVAAAAEAITAENVAEYQVDEETIQSARVKLVAYGFEVGRGGAHSLSVSGDRELFERVFQTRLSSSTSIEAEPGVSVGTGPVYEAEVSPTIPDDLTDFVADVVFPRAPELYP